MTAALLAEALRALVPFAEIAASPAGRFPHFERARDVLRKAAPCEMCNGFPGDPVIRTGRPCAACSGVGCTQASLDAAIAQAEERERLARRMDAAVTVLLNEAHGSRGQRIAVETLASIVAERRAVIGDDHA